MKHLGFSITESKYNVAIISQGDIESTGTTESFDEMIRIKNLLKVKLKQNFPLKLMISEQDNSNLVLILMTDSEDDESHDNIVKKSLDDFCSQLPKMYSELLLIALGEAVDSLMKIHNSYMQAQDVISLYDDSDYLAIVHFRNLDKKMEDFYYPLELESRLINSVKAGNLENLKNLIDTLTTENIEKRYLDRTKLKMFLSSLFNSCFRIMNQLSDNSKNELSHIADLYNSELDFESVSKLLEEICEVQNKNKKSHNNSLIDKVIDYLGKNSSNKNLSLYMVAEHFSISESYLFFFFKEQTGTNFSTFLEKIRMENGKDLLLNSDEPIHIIAGKIGYNSDKTFRRVFQKRFNISPGQFREG